MVAMAERLTDLEYLREVEALAHAVCERAFQEGWLAYTDEPADASPLQRAINELARNLRHVHYKGDGCIEDEERPDVSP